MKRIILASVLASFFTIVNAQLITDDFESNNLGWTEEVGSDKMAVIKEGHLYLNGKSTGAMSTCYAPFDIDKPFELKCEAYIKSLSGSKFFGIFVDYEDDNNYIRFTVEDDRVFVRRVVENRIVAERSQPLKLKSKKKTGIDFKIEYTLQKITLFINDMKAIDYQRRVDSGQFMLGTTGIGFYAGKNTEVYFDNLQIIQ